MIETEKPLSGKYLPEPKLIVEEGGDRGPINVFDYGNGVFTLVDADTSNRDSDIACVLSFLRGKDLEIEQVLKWDITPGARPIGATILTKSVNPQPLQK